MSQLVPTLGPQAIPRMWDRLSGLPGGKRLFSAAVGRAAPYTGTVGAVVQALGPGYCQAVLRDRRGVRNHLRSVHAIALANFGEMTTGLAMMAALPATARGIPIEITIEFVKKARGAILAEAYCEAPDAREQHEHIVEARLQDEARDLVARFKARWVIGPKS